MLDLHRNQNGVHLDLDEPHSDERRDSSDSEVKTVVRSRDSSLSEEHNVIDNVPKESKVTKRAKRSDINANTRISSRTSDNGENSEGIDDEDNSDNVYEDNEYDNVDSDRLAEDYTDSGLTSPSSAKKVHSRKSKNKTSPSPKSSKGKNSLSLTSNSLSNTSNAPNIDSSSNVSDSEQTDASERGDTTRPRASSSGNSGAELDKEDEELLKREFEKLRSFAREVVPRPLYEEAKFEEEVEEEPREDSMEYVRVDHEESQEDFNTRFFTFDKVHDADSRGLPDFDLDYEYHDIGFNEIDPDLLSMNLAPILEETEEELLEEEDEEEEDDEQDWRGNWMFKGMKDDHLFSIVLFSSLCMLKGCILNQLVITK